MKLSSSFFSGFLLTVYCMLCSSSPIYQYKVIQLPNHIGNIKFLPSSNPLLFRAPTVSLREAIFVHIQKSPANIGHSN
jgi:hypothetical protein